MFAAPETSGIFTPTGNMITPRAWHTATLLNDGKVLIAGGEQISEGQQDGISSAELYDPDSGSFDRTARMTTERALHTATLLNNGKVLIAGGRRDRARQLLASAELYDPDTRTFTPTGNMTAARVSHTATLLNNGQVLIVGGWAPSAPFAVASAELYDPLTGTFTATNDMTVAWFGSTATLLPDGNVLIASAYGDAIGSAAEVYDRFTGTFMHKGTRTDWWTHCCWY
jgi:hypothetical protein